MKRIALVVGTTSVLALIGACSSSEEMNPGADVKDVDASSDAGGESASDAGGDAAKPGIDASSDAGEGDAAVDDGGSDAEADASTDPCAGKTCSGHGTCEGSPGADGGEVATCTCDAPYAGPNCDTCATGFQDNDGNGTCAPACGTSTCNSHGTCSDATGATACTCTTGFTGAACDTCATGFTGAACDVCVAGKGGAKCDFDLVLGLDIPTAADWNTVGDVPYDVDNTAAAGNFSRVAYRLVLGTEEVWAEMDPFTTSKAQLGIPVDWMFKQAVQNVTIVSKAANTPSVAVPTTGGIEFWSNCYDTPGGNGGVYDYDDTPTTDDCYGSFQLSIGTDMVFSYNRWSGGGDSDLGFGNQPTGHPDWTFSQNSASYAVRRLEVYVKALP